MENTSNARPEHLYKINHPTEMKDHCRSIVWMNLFLKIIEPEQYGNLLRRWTYQFVSMKF